MNYFLGLQVFVAPYVAALSAGWAVYLGFSGDLTGALWFGIIAILQVGAYIMAKAWIRSTEDRQVRERERRADGR